MHLYKINAPGAPKPKYASNKADASASRRSMVSETVKFSAVTIEDVEVPTDKDGLLKFLNS